MFVFPHDVVIRSYLHCSRICYEGISMTRRRNRVGQAAELREGRSLQRSHPAGVGVSRQTRGLSGGAREKEELHTRTEARGGAHRGFVFREVAVTLLWLYKNLLHRTLCNWVLTARRRAGPGLGGPVEHEQPVWLLLVWHVITSPINRLKYLRD